MQIEKRVREMLESHPRFSEHQEPFLPQKDF
jgi:hypothetical protein